MARAAFMGVLLLKRDARPFRPLPFAGSPQTQAALGFPVLIGLALSKGSTQDASSTFPRQILLYIQRMWKNLTGDVLRVCFVQLNVPLITVLLVLVNVLAYRLELASGGQTFCEQFGLVPARFVHGGALEPLFTSLFLHDPGDPAHIVGNMAFLTLFGALVEKALGSCRFAALYLLAGVMGSLTHILVTPSSTDPLVGASGAIFGVLAVAGALYPRLLGFVVAFASLNVWHAFFGGAGNVSFACHIGGFVAGFLVVVLLRAIGSEALEAA